MNGTWGKRVGVDSVEYLNIGKRRREDSIFFILINTYTKNVYCLCSTVCGTGCKVVCPTEPLLFRVFSPSFESTNEAISAVYSVFSPVILP